MYQVETEIAAIPIETAMRQDADTSTLRLSVLTYRHAGPDDFIALSECDADHSDH